jgi:LysR family transcriptional regulator, hydrogen peroxide-inducible genes activator
MSVSSLSLRDLEYLVAVADEKNFGRAALSCHVSQPALSAQIKKTESVLGLEVFERSKKRVGLTEKGTAIVAQARVVLQEAGVIFSLARAQSEPLTGPFRLGAIATVGPYLVPHLLGPFREAFPRLELRLKEGLTDGLLAELRSGSLDVILAARTFKEDGFAVYPLYSEPFVLAAPRGHRILSKEPLRPADLNASDMVLLEDGHCLRDETLDICSTHRRGKVREFHATSLETLKHLVAARSGYTLIPLLAARSDARLKDLVEYRRLEGKPVGRSVALVCRDSFSRKDEVRLLAKVIRQSVPKTSFLGLRVTA